MCWGTEGESGSPGGPARPGPARGPLTAVFRVEPPGRFTASRNLWVKV